MVGVFVNDEYVPVGYQLNNKDRVRVVTADLAFGPREDWIKKRVQLMQKEKLENNMLNYKNLVKNQRK